MRVHTFGQATRKVKGLLADCYIKNSIWAAASASKRHNPGVFAEEVQRQAAYRRKICARRKPSNERTGGARPAKQLGEIARRS
jgi:hypothetical protein